MSRSAGAHEWGDAGGLTLYAELYRIQQMCTPITYTFYTCVCVCVYNNVYRHNLRMQKVSDNLSTLNQFQYFCVCL